jgi:23S rRNA (cytosine1962-C5)-methyltransferase
MSDYELLDAGDGRRLERFGARVVARPAPGAHAPRRLPEAAWDAADLVFERGQGPMGRWIRGSELGPWVIVHDGLTLELRPATGGQVGLFPEHASLWSWLRDAATVDDAGGTGEADETGDPGKASERIATPQVLSLFAYTGGATLALARAGAQVVHVDASRPAVSWARHNASLSGLGERPIRWIVDDALAFVRREIRRGRTYDGIVLDPPSYGHGPRGRWRIDEHLPELLERLEVLTRGRLRLLLLTAHTPGHDGMRLAGLVAEAFGVVATSTPLVLQGSEGVWLDAGWAARWTPGVTA